MNDTRSAAEDFTAQLDRARGALATATAAREEADARAAEAKATEDRARERVDFLERALEANARPKGKTPRVDIDGPAPR